MIIYEHPYTFDVPEWAADDAGWTPDCNGKLDFDPTLLHFSCRVWRDGDYHCALYLGEKIIDETKIMRAESVSAARVAVETWCRIQTARVIAALAQAGVTRTGGDGEVGSVAKP